MRNGGTTIASSLIRLYSVITTYTVLRQRASVAATSSRARPHPTVIGRPSPAAAGTPHREPLMEELALVLPAMWADHHVLAVNGILSALTGVQGVLASALRRTVQVRFDLATTNAQAITAALSAAGYQPGELTPPRRRRRTSRRGRCWASGRRRPTPSTSPCPATTAGTERRQPCSPRPSLALSKPSTPAAPVRGRRRGALRKECVDGRQTQYRPGGYRDARPGRRGWHRHGVHAGREDEALPHRRERRLLPHLQHGALPAGGQGRREHDRHLRRRPFDDRRRAASLVRWPAAWRRTRTTAATWP